MELTDVVDKYSSNLFGHVRMVKANEMRIFVQHVHNDQNCILTLRLRKTRHEVHCKVNEDAIRNFQ